MLVFAADDGDNSGAAESSGGENLLSHASNYGKRRKSNEGFKSRRVSNTPSFRRGSSISQDGKLR